MLSQTVEYALQAMCYLASLNDPAATSHSISLTTRIPHGYLSKVMRDLVRAELVRSARGRRGGFSLARPASNISLLDIVHAVDPALRPRHAKPTDTHRQALEPTLHRHLGDALAHVERCLADTTLASILSRPTDTLHTPRRQSA